MYTIYVTAANTNNNNMSKKPADDLWIHWDELGKTKEGDQRPRVKCRYCDNSQMKNAPKCRQHLIVCPGAPVEVKEMIRAHLSNQVHRTSGAGDGAQKVKKASGARLEREIKELTKKNLELKRQKLEIELETLREQRQIMREKLELEVLLLRQKLGQL